MTTNARKTDAQRLGNGKKAFNVKQVEKMVEDAGGTEYTAGTGIVISNDEISVDGQTVAMKSELPPILTAISPIDINAQNQINLKGWVLVPNSERDTLIDNTEGKVRVTEDIIVCVSSMGDAIRVTYLPKDICLYNQVDVIHRESLGFMGYYKYRDVIKSNITATIQYKRSYFALRSSGANEYIEFVKDDVSTLQLTASDSETNVSNVVRIYRRA